METRQIHVRDLSTVTGIQQYEHCVQSIFFLGLEDFEGSIYLSIESGEFNEDIALTNNTFIIGQPMTKFNTTYTCQIYGIVNNGEKIQLSKQFRMMIDKSNDISGEAGEYPIDPNIVNGIDQYITEKESQIDDYVEQVIESIPSDYSTLEQATYNAYPSESETGNPIYFDDGADDIPVKELIVNLEPKQSGSGDPSPSNVRAISGYDGVTVKQTGKNLLDITGTTITTGGITFTVNDDGTITVNGTATANAWFTVKIIQKSYPFDLYLGGCHSNNENIRMQVNIDNLAYQCTDAPILILAGSVIDTVLIRIASGTTVNNEVFEPMLRVSTSDDTFEPYQGEEYSITFPTEVGTVYGGTLNVTTGELVVDKKAITIDSTLTIKKSTTYRGNFYTDYVESTFGIKNNNSHGTLICSHGKYIGRPSSSFVYGTCALDGAINLFLGTEAMTIAEFKSWLDEQKSSGTPVTVVGDLIAPLTYQLTPTEVTTLLGSNTIMSDGSMDLSYRADTTIVIEKLTNAIISMGGNV